MALSGVMSIISLVARAQNVVVSLAHQASHCVPLAGPTAKAGGTCGIVGERRQEEMLRESLQCRLGSDVSSCQVINAGRAPVAIQASRKQLEGGRQFAGQPGPEATACVCKRQALLRPHSV